MRATCAEEQRVYGKGQPTNTDGRYNVHIACHLELAPLILDDQSRSCMC